jgi:hypothetical protein
MTLVLQVSVRLGKTKLAVAPGTVADTSLSSYNGGHQA